jgi:hypothetical protein
MQPTKFVTVTLLDKIRKDEWINSKLEGISTSRKQKFNIIPLDSI